MRAPVAQVWTLLPCPGSACARSCALPCSYACSRPGTCSRSCSCSSCVLPATNFPARYASNASTNSPNVALIPMNHTKLRSDARLAT
jgi:hypothetical protein